MDKVKSKVKKISISESIISNKVFNKEYDEWEPVRIKFQMNESAFSDLKWLADYFHVSQKELLDDITGNESFLHDMAKAASKIDDIPRSKLPRKTKVISKGSMTNLKQAAEKYGVPRDLIVELLILWLSNSIREGMKSKKDDRTSAHGIVNELCSTIEEYEDNLKTLLGEDDPIVSRMGILAIMAMNLSYAIESELKHEIPIDPSDYSQSA